MKMVGFCDVSILFVLACHFIVILVWVRLFVMVVEAPTYWSKVRDIGVFSFSSGWSRCCVWIFLILTPQITWVWRDTVIFRFHWGC